MSRLEELIELITNAYGKGDVSKETEHLIGGHLAEAFSLLPAGRFGKWCKTNLPMISSSRCYNYKWWFGLHSTTSLPLPVRTQPKVKPQQQLEPLTEEEKSTKVEELIHSNRQYKLQVESLKFEIKQLKERIAVYEQTRKV